VNIATRIRLLGALAGVLLVAVTLVTVLIWLRSWPAIAVLAAVAMVASLVARRLARRVKRGTVLELDLDGGVVESHGTDPLSRALTREAVEVRDVVDALDRAAGDDRITAVVARLGNGNVQLAHAQEIRDAVARFRDSGKTAFAFAETFGESGQATIDYYLASAFSEIHLMPLGELSITGLLAKGRFIRDLLDKLGVVVNLDHREEYKSALYRLTETEFNQPHRESTMSLVGDQFDQVVTGIAASRGLSEQRVRELIDTAPHLGERPVEDGLVDHRSYRDEVFRAAGGNARLFASRYLKKAGRPNRKGEIVALIHGVGMITRGSSRFNPLGGGPSFGADDVAGAFRKAVDDKKVKAIVFRVDSPGGSAIASETVRHEVERATQAGKPVVVSMGNVAGSGGYWVSTPASHIVAQPATITGSIGVVSGKLVTSEALAKAGITSDQIEFGKMAGFASSHAPYTDEERRKLDAQLDTIYNEFIGLVSSGRNLERERVAEIAKGRVWTGSQAKEIGLVDSLGGLDRAVDEAKKAAHIDGDCKVRVYPKEKTLPFTDRRDNSDPSVDALSGIIASLRSVKQEAIGSAQVRVPGF
jgi:protease-4